MERDKISAPTASRQVAEDGLDVLGALPALRRYAHSLTRDAGDAEDLVHDALVRAYEKQASFRPEKGMRKWLLAILHNTFIDGIRSRRADKQRIEKLTSQAHPDDLHAAPNQDNVLRLAQVRQAFMALPEEQRAVLHLVAIEGQSYAQTAQTLDLPIGTVMSRLARARATLRSFEETPTSEQPATSHTSHLRIVGGSDDTAG